MDDQPDLIAALDQASAGLASLAGVLGRYMAALIGEGFTREEALMLVGDYQRLVYMQSQGEPDD